MEPQITITITPEMKQMIGKIDSVRGGIRTIEGQMEKMPHGFPHSMVQEVDGLHQEIDRILTALGNEVYQAIKEKQA